MQVKNAQKELLQWYADNARSNPKIFHATERCAAGIIEAIGHFNLGPNLSPRDVVDISSYKLESFSPGLEIVKLYILYERWLRGEMGSSELIKNLKAICVSPNAISSDLFYFLFISGIIKQEYPILGVNFFLSFFSSWPQ